MTAEEFQFGGEADQLFGILIGRGVDIILIWRGGEQRA